MRLSRASAYALGSVLQLADAPVGIPIPCSHLAKLGEMPERFLLQVLRNLVTHKILNSTRGVDGGYSLARRLEEITFLQLLEATDGPLIPTIPPLDSIPRISRGKLQDLLVEMTAAENSRLNGIKLSDIHAPQSIAPEEFESEQEESVKPDQHDS